MKLSDAAEKLRNAQKTKTAIRPFTEAYGTFSIDEGYAVQKLGLEMALGEKRVLTGYKMGLTSRAKQVDVQVFEPIRGYLMADMEVEKNSRVSVENWIHPRIEPEIAVVLKEPLEGRNVTLRDVVKAIEFVGPALEILDSRYENFSFKIADVIADNTSAAGFMVGASNWKKKISEIPLMGVLLKKNGEIVETGAPAAVLGDPLLSVVALARSLAVEGKRIKPGQVILTGGITTSVSFGKGDVIEVLWPGETLTFQAV